MTRGRVHQNAGRQRGAAILTAMLTVVLVATLAAGALWQQWRGIEVEAAERSRTQMAWILTGALDWGRLILREDARQGGADHLAEPWAVPLAQARLSTFLAFDRSDTLAADEASDAFLSGWMLDLQSRLNITNLIQDGKIHGPSRVAFERLFKHLNRPPSELAVMVDQLLLAQCFASDQAAAPNAPLCPQDIDQLAWLGLSVRTIAVLRPFVTVLPQPTPVNLNTAPAEVIYASVETFDMADAQLWVSTRNASPLKSLAEANAKVPGKSGATFQPKRHDISTSYFEVNGRLQIDQTTVQEKSVVKREGQGVKTLLRQRGVAVAMPPLQ
jgi:general secretion pathway protein K